jgi:transcriptional regulator
MYLPSHFEESRPEVLQQTLRNHPLGLLLTLSANGIEANAIPFLYDAERGPHGSLRGHVARANPVWREARPDMPATVVFQGPQAYVSPAWYATKAETGKVVPTWNYVMVQARGALTVIDDAAWLRRLVGELTDRHEGRRAAPWSVDDAPADYVDGLLRAIVGIEIAVESLQGKWKVTQNRPADRESVARGLTEAAPGNGDNRHAMAAQVRAPGAA